MYVLACISRDLEIFISRKIGIIAGNHHLVTFQQVGDKATCRVLASSDSLARTLSMAMLRSAYVLNRSIVIDLFYPDLLPYSVSQADLKGSFHARIPGFR